MDPLRGLSKAGSKPENPSAIGRFPRSPGPRDVHDCYYTVRTRRSIRGLGAIASWSSSTMGERKASR